MTKVHIRRIWTMIVEWLTTKPNTKANWILAAISFTVLCMTIWFNTVTLRQNNVALTATMTSIQLQEASLSNAVRAIQIELVTRIHPKLVCKYDVYGMMPDSRHPSLLVRNVGATKASAIDISADMYAFVTNSVRLRQRLYGAITDGRNFTNVTLAAGPKLFGFGTASTRGCGNLRTPQNQDGKDFLDPGESAWALGLCFNDRLCDVIDRDFHGEIIMVVNLSYDRTEATFQHYQEYTTLYWDGGYFVSPSVAPSAETIIRNAFHCSVEDTYSLHAQVDCPIEWWICDPMGRKLIDIVDPWNIPKEGTLPFD